MNLSLPLISGLAAAAATVIALPLVLWGVHRYEIYDGDGPLKIHTKRTARLGGIAMMAGWLAGGAVAWHLIHARALIPLICLLVIWGTGLIDDLRELPSLLRLGVQLAAGALLWWGGWSIPLFENNILNLLLTCFFVATCINAFNLLDGADGVAAGVAVVIALGYAFLPVPQMSILGRVTTATLAGCCLGFLVFNFPPARIFMGDSGSTVLGLMVAFLSLEFYSSSPRGNVQWMVPFVFAALPLMDLVLAIVRRIRKGASMFSGDRQHFYDLLLQRGWKPRQVALICALFTAGLVVTGWLVLQHDLVISMVAVIVGVTPLLFVAVYLGSLRVENVIREDS